MVAQVSLSKKQDPISKITKAKGHYSSSIAPALQAQSPEFKAPSTAKIL
jgi:hypothetical protein